MSCHIAVELETRGEWRFEYTALSLTRPTEAKLAHHTERLRVWNRICDEAERAARGGFIDVVRQPQCGRGEKKWKVKISISDEQCAVLSEAREKVEHHKDCVLEYTMFLAQFKRAPEDTRMLALGDMEFFGLNDQEEV